MKRKTFVNNAKLITIIFVMVVLTGCGGGRATTTSSTPASVPTSDPISTGGPTPTADPAPVATGTAELSWFPPTAYTDGTAITELAGHNIYVNDGGVYKKLASINNAGITTYLVENLSSGIHTFVVTAFDAQGIESAFSTEASITIGS